MLRLTRRRSVPSTALVAVGGALLLCGCYATVPLAPGPEPVGRAVEFELNDLGRVAMGPQVGPSVRTITGRLSSQSDEAWTVQVARIVDLQNVPQVWSGEALTIRREHVRTSVVRRLDPVRTGLLAAGLGGGLLAFFASRNLFGLGGGSASVPNPGDPAGQ